MQAKLTLKQAFGGFLLRSTSKDMTTSRRGSKTNNTLGVNKMKQAEPCFAKMAFKMGNHGASKDFRRYVNKSSFVQAK